jgi:hypothetical protein
MSTVGQSEPADVRFGKVLVDRRGLTNFKRANPWLGQVDELPSA